MNASKLNRLVENGFVKILYSPHATFEQINPLSSARGDPYERRYYLLKGHIKRGKGWKQIELDA